MFPNLRFPRVIWIGLNDAEQKLSKVQQAIAAACRPLLGQELEERFSGHVTLARVKKLARNQSQVLSSLIAGLENLCFGEWRADEIALMRSELGSEGARHTSIANLRFQAIGRTGDVKDEV